MNLVKFLWLIVIGFSTLLKLFKSLRSNVITLDEFDEVIILNLIVFVECESEI